LVIAYGLNDMRAGMDMQEFQQETSAIIERVRQSLSPLIIIANVYHMPAYHFYPPYRAQSAIRACGLWRRSLVDPKIRR
jgi:hypothetical protein